MTQKQDIQDELVAVSAVIDGARSALTRNEILDIKGVPERVRDVANAITDLPPEDAADMRPPLLKLLADFKEFAAELSAKIEEIESSGGASGQVVASGQSGTR